MDQISADVFYDLSVIWIFYYSFLSMKPSECKNWRIFLKQFKGDKSVRIATIVLAVPAY